MKPSIHHDIERLLKDIESVQLKYQKLNEASGSNFNIFSLIRKGTEEVELHSQFIGELLNPKGTHSQKDTFLKLFIRQLNIRNKNDELIVGDFELFIEKPVGNYGRIDLLIRSKDQLIIIENKIYASDQPRQLQRYSDAAKALYGNLNLNLFYLTLQENDKPSPCSMGNLQENDVQCISYAKEIRCWLNDCVKEVYDIPVIRETMIQYKRLLDNLTGQSINEEQKMDLQKLLFKDNNFEHALSIEAILTETKIEIQKFFWRELQTELATIGFDFSMVNNHFEPVDINICDNFYATRNKSIYYGLQCKILQREEYAIHLFIEIESDVYFGLTVSKNERRANLTEEFSKAHPDLAKKLTKIESITIENNNEWWIGLQQAQKASEKVNFKNFHEGITSKLANESYRRKFIDNMSNDISQLIKRVQQIE